MKRKSIESLEEAQMQDPLKNTLKLFHGNAKDLLLFYLYKEHGVSVYNL